MWPWAILIVGNEHSIVFRQINGNKILFLTQSLGGFRWVIRKSEIGNEDKARIHLVPYT